MAMMEPDFGPQIPQVDYAPPPEIPEALRLLIEASQHRNLAEDMAEDRRAKIAHDVLLEYKLDKDSMSDWTERMKKGLDLAKLIRKDKTTPWPGASNVRYPLLTTAALQFNARAYPAIVPGADPVLCTVHGNDKGGKKAARGERVSRHMGYQLMFQIPEWELETDALTTVLPVVGTMLRKTWRDETMGRPRVKLCEPGSVIINNKAKSIDNAPRVSEEVPLYPYEIVERKRAGLYLDIDLLPDGDTSDEDGPQTMIEQHRRLDLDEDGYPEPYVVTVHKASQKVMRIVANFEAEDIVFDGERVISIQRRDYYSVFHFLPSMDGGFWGTGLGMLLGDISETINTTINQLIDSGAMSTLGGGFIGTQNLRLKGGAQRFRPGEWKQVNVLGDDIRKGLVPIPVAQPSPVLFQLLGLLMEAGREVASIKDIMTGDTGGRSMTATTTLALIEQGMALFNAAYKRLYLGLRNEFKMLARINAETLDPMEYSAFHDEVDERGQPVMFDPAEDYALEDMDITPVADPKIVTSMQAMGRAQLLMELSQTGAVDPKVAATRVLEVAHVRDVEELVPQPNPIALQIEQRQLEHGLMMMEAEIEAARADIALTSAKVQQAMASAAKDFADADLDKMKMGLDAARLRLEGVNTRRQHLIKIMETDDKRGPGGMAGQPGNGAAFQQPSPVGGNAEIPDMRGLLGGGGNIPGGQGAA